MVTIVIGTKTYKFNVNKEQRKIIQKIAESKKLEKIDKVLFFELLTMGLED